MPQDVNCPLNLTAVNSHRYDVFELNAAYKII